MLCRYRRAGAGAQRAAPALRPRS